MRVMAHIPELRTADPFVLFLMPDDEFGNFSENSEIVSVFNCRLQVYLRDFFLVFLK